MQTHVGLIQVRVALSTFLPILLMGCGGALSPSQSDSLIGFLGIAAQVQSVNVIPGATAILTIALDQAAPTEINFSYSTTDGTAVSGTQYVGMQGTGVIAKDTKSATVSISTMNNSGLAYLNKSFLVSFDFAGALAALSATVTFTANPQPVTFQNVWTATATVGEPAARAGHSAVWANDRMIIWGGMADSFARAVYNDGKALDPALNQWTPISSLGAPWARARHGAVWTGSKMIIWGGFFGTMPTYPNDGGIYDKTTDSWSKISAVGAPSGRARFVTVWTGTKMIIWGGESITSTGRVPVCSGGIYDLATDTWMALNSTGAPSARYDAMAAWTGSKLLIWGGSNSASAGAPGLGDGAVYDPAHDSWTTMSATGAPSARQMASAVWTGTELIIWGGNSVSSPSASLADGARYNPATNKWTALSMGAAPAARYSHSAVWSGTQMLIWGGNSNTTDFNDGGAYNPLTNTWAALSTSGAPEARSSSTAVWSGASMILFGGLNASQVTLQTGGMYH